MVQVIVVPWVSRVYGICTLRAVICIPSGCALGNTYNCPQSTNPIHPRNPWYNYYLYVSVTTSETETCVIHFTDHTPTTIHGSESMNKVAMNEPLIEVDSSANDQHTDSITILTKALEQIHLDAARLPPEMREDFQKIKDALPKSFSVLVSGRAGVGKSTLVNGIIGKRVAEEGGLIEQDVTKKLTPYSRNVSGVDVTVWDSPGLQDGSDNQNQSRYISEMQEKCSSVDVALYCINMAKKRFPRSRSDNPDVLAMARITEAFGPDFWKNTIVVLTFANVVEAVNMSWRKLDASAKAATFQEELERWRGIIQDVLINEIRVPQEIAMSVIVAPAGHYDDHQLPDRDYWLSSFWFCCLEVTATPEGRLALVRMNKARLVRQSEVPTNEKTLCTIS